MVCSWLRWALTLASEMSGAASAVAGAAVAAGAETTPSTAARAVTPAPSLVFHFMAVSSFGGVGQTVNVQVDRYPVSAGPAFWMPMPVTVELLHVGLDGLPLP